MINSVTRFGEISALWQHFMNLCQTVEGLFSVLHMFQPTLVKLLFWGSLLMLFMAKY